jgi:hypothetical protein
VNEDELAEFLEQGPPPGRRGRPARSTRPDGARAGAPGPGNGPTGGAADGVRRLLGDEATWAEPAADGADALFAAVRAELPHRPPTAGADPRRAVPRPHRVRPPAAPPAPDHPDDLTPARAWGLLAPRARAVTAAAAAALAVLGLLAGLALGGDGGAAGNEWAAAPAWPLAGAEGARGATGEVRAKDTSSGLELWLVVDGLPAAPGGTYYEASLAGPSGAVPVGTFHLREGNDPIILWSGVALAEYPTFVVTRRTEGAGPEAAGEPVLSGSVGP